ncbi:MAG: ABC transporter ATP-binding protein [Negativicutes bacterium]
MNIKTNKTAGKAEAKVAKQRVGLLALSEDKDDELKPFDYQMVLRLLKYLRPYRKLVIAAVLVSAVAALLGITFPYFLKQAIDVCVKNKDLQHLWNIGIIMAVIAISQYLLLILQGRLLVKTAQSAIFDIRVQLFEHLQHLSLSFFDRQKAGRIILRLTNDVDALDELLTNGIMTLFVDTLSLVCVIVIMFFVDWQLMLLMFMLIPAFFLVITYMQRAMLHVSRSMRKQLSAVNANLNEALLGIKVTQAFNRESLNCEMFGEINESNYRSSQQFVRLNALFWVMMGMLEESYNVALLLCGGVLLVFGATTLGTVAAFYAYGTFITHPMRHISELFNIISRVMAACERIFEILDIHPEVSDKPAALAADELRGVVEFAGVNFSYKADEPVLRDINFSVAAGQTVALVGPTGAGKTTIINLVCRFYDAVDGVVKIDGVDVREYKQRDFRSNIAVVLQDVFVFAGTVIDNIRYGKPDATPDAVIETAKMVGLHDYIETLPEKYQTEIFENGSNLSTGQKQLLAFARALIRRPQILILDEATANIDSQAEQKIQTALAKLLEGRTAFVIAHRLSTIRNADMIMVIKDGIIAEHGTHEQLLQLNGEYASLYDRGFSDEE